MSVLVRIPTPLRRMTNGQAKVELDSVNLGEMVEQLDSSFPGFKARLVDENGELRYFVNIYITLKAARHWAMKLWSSLVGGCRTMW